MSFHIPGPGEIRHDDVVIVIEPKRRYFGRLCQVSDIDRKTIVILPIKRIDVSCTGLVQLSFLEGKEGRTIRVRVKREEISRVAWPATRSPLKAMEELDLV